MEERYFAIIQDTMGGNEFQQDKGWRRWRKSRPNRQNEDILLYEISGSPELERHRKIVSIGLTNLLNTWDKQVADEIEFPGSIRYTLYENRNLLRKGTTVEGLDSSLNLSGKNFSVNMSSVKGSPLREYTIEFLDYLFRYSIQVDSSDKRTALSAYTGSTMDEYSRIHIGLADVLESHGITIFPVDTRDGQILPLRLEPAAGVEAYYSNIESNGDIRLLFWNGFSHGEYSVHDDSVVSIAGDSYIDDTNTRIGVISSNGKFITVPIKTNLYTQIKTILPEIEFPNLLY